MHTPIVKPLHFDRAIKIVKQLRMQARVARRIMEEAQEQNSPLWQENKRLRELVASLERSLRIVSEERDAARQRLEAIDTALSHER